MMAPLEAMEALTPTFLKKHLYGMAEEMEGVEMEVVVQLLI